MKTVWTVTNYVQSAMPLTDKVTEVMSVTFVIVDENPPSDELILALLNSHTRNLTPVMSEVHKSSVPDELFK